MTKNIRLLGILFMAVWAATVDAHYYNNVRVNDTPVRCLAQTDDEPVKLRKEVRALERRQVLRFRGDVYGRVYEIRLFLQMLPRGFWHDTVSLYQEYKSLKL